jgi:hypothetical protein
MRGSVGTGNQIMIAGFVIEAGFDGSVNVPKLVLICGIGPQFADFGVQGTIEDPLLRLFSGATQIAENDNWEDANDVGALTQKSTLVGAFGLTSGSKDSVLLIWLLPGSYTAQVSGVGGITGLALVEVYAVP